MSEDKSKSSSNPESEEEKKNQRQNVPPASPSPSAQTAPPAAQAPAPQRPVVAPAAGTAATAPPRPAVSPPPIPPSRPAAPKSTGRRNLLKALVAVGAVLSITPFVPWGSFLSSSVGTSGKYQRQKVVIDDVSKYGAAAGKAVNVNDLNTFAPDSHWVVTYPSSGDASLDAQNPDTFVKFELIRLPAGSPFNGDSKDAAAFVAFSKVCVHLWCSPNYNPASDHEQYECPCHGSIYRIPDGLSNAGPASEQPPPTNAIPMLTLTADPNGDLYIEAPLWDVDHNGVIGYGRNYQSYRSYILPAAEGKA